MRQHLRKHQSALTCIGLVLAIIVLAFVHGAAQVPFDSSDASPVLQGTGGTQIIHISPPQYVLLSHCESVAYDFDWYDPDGGQGTVLFSLGVGSPGSIDQIGMYSYPADFSQIDDTLLVTVRVCRPDTNCTEALVRLVITNDPPLFTAGCGTQIDADFGVPATIDLDAEDSCPSDARDYFLMSSGGLTGALTVSPSNGAVTLSANPADLGRHEVLVGVTDNADTSTCTVAFNLPGQSAIVVDSVNGLIDGDMPTARTIELCLRLTVDPGLQEFLAGYTNGFAVYSPDGAGWDSVYHKYHDSWPRDSLNGFDYNVLTSFGINGLGRDTVTFGGVTFFSPFGVAPGFDETVWSIFIKTAGDLSNIGKTICLDTVSNYPPGNSWKWNDRFVNEYFPRWGGPYCFTLVEGGCCVGGAGNVNGDTGDAVDISDLTLLVNHLFVTFTPLPCPAEANTNGDTGCAVDISDLTRLVNHLFVTFDPLASCLSACE